MKNGSMGSRNDGSTVSVSDGSVPGSGPGGATEDGAIGEHEIQRVPAWRRWVVQWDISHNAIPLAFFAFTAMWQAVSNHLMDNIPNTIYLILFYVSCIILFLTVSLFAMRVILYPTLIVTDFTHPRLMNFFYMPVIIGSLFVLTLPKPGGNADNETLFRVAFFILGSYQVALSLYMFGEWLFGLHPTNFIHPLVFMQTIGFFLTANLAARGALVELSKAMLYVGILFWLLVFITNFQHVSLALDKQRERPSPPFFLFIAPPAQTAIAFVVLEGAMNPGSSGMRWPELGEAFLYIDLFLYVLILRLFPTFWTSKFNVSSWAYIFPLSGASSAIIIKYTSTGLIFWEVLSFLTGVIACIAMIIVLVFTIRSLGSGQTPKNPTSLKAYTRYYLRQEQARGSQAETRADASFPAADAV